MMKPILETITVCFKLLNTDFAAEIDFRITTRATNGTPQSFNYPGDPGEPAEFEIVKIELKEDNPRIHNPPILELPEWLDTLICESDLVHEAIQEFDWKDRLGDYDE
jgi:hypothetical protein